MLRSVTLIRSCKSTVCVPALVALLCSCSSNNPRYESQLSALDAGLRSVREIQADHTAELAALRNDLRAVTGKVEEMQFAQDRALQGDLGRLKNQLSSLQRRVPPPPIVPADLLESDENEAARLTGEVAPVYQEALAAIRGGAFAEAVTKLQAAMGYVARGEEIGAPILFWTAVANDGLGQFRDALAAYNECAATYPHSPRAAASLLRQASALIKLKDSKTAKLTLQKLMLDYPKSPEAKVAQQRLNDLR